jgi:prevent-host-death family protein
MKTVDVDEAKSALSQLLAEVESGEGILIARDGIPVARLVGIRQVLAREPRLWRNHPGWEGYVYDVSVLAPMTDGELDEEGWP